MTKKRSVKEPWALYFRRLDKLYLKPHVHDTIQTLIKEAYIYNNITPEFLGTRKRKLVDTNSVIAKLIRQYFKLGYADLGILFGKNHATVIHYISHYEDCLCLEDDWKNFHDYLCEVIHSTKYDSFNIERYDVDSLNYQELRNAFNSLVIQYRKTDEKLTEIKSILEIENEE
tara:strand:+ start:2461 stop:2976 length:516 start_codon:yes stop_codon:yes gene_type:complete